MSFRQVNAKWEGELRASNAGEKGRQRPSVASTGGRSSSPRPDEGCRVQVGVRLRPPFQHEVLPRGVEPVISLAGQDVTIHHVNEAKGANEPVSRKFKFDHAFGPEAGQEEVYDALVKDIVSGMLAGSNGSVLVYGQTGAGKTHTMGVLERLTEHSEGIVPSTMRDIFAFVNDFAPEAAVTITFVQLYVDSFQDLLCPHDGAPLTIREKNGEIYLDGATARPVMSFKHAINVINEGLTNRVMAPTSFNVTSSRSHTILTISVDYLTATLSDMDTKVRIRGKLNLVDLAGSERIDKSNDDLTRIEEARKINTSLTAISRVVSALVDPAATHVPYRSCKLTRLLQDSLGGHCRLALLAALSPSLPSKAETHSTLQFAARCMRIYSQNVTATKLNYRQMCYKLQYQLQELEREYQKREELLHARYENLTEKGSSVAGSDGWGDIGSVKGGRKDSEETRLKAQALFNQLMFQIYEKVWLPIRENAVREQQNHSDTSGLATSPDALRRMYADAKADVECRYLSNNIKLEGQEVVARYISPFDMEGSDWNFVRDVDVKVENVTAHMLEMKDIILECISFLNRVLELKDKYFQDMKKEMTALYVHQLQTDQEMERMHQGLEEKAQTILDKDIEIQKLHIRVEEESRKSRSFEAEVQRLNGELQKEIYKNKKAEDALLQAHALIKQTKASNDARNATANAQAAAAAVVGAQLIHDSADKWSDVSSRTEYHDVIADNGEGSPSPPEPHSAIGTLTEDDLTLTNPIALSAAPSGAGVNETMYESAKSISTGAPLAYSAQQPTKSEPRVLFAEPDRNGDRESEAPSETGSRQGKRPSLKAIVTGKSFRKLFSPNKNRDKGDQFRSVVAAAQSAQHHNEAIGFNKAPSTKPPLVKSKSTAILEEAKRKEAEQLDRLERLRASHNKAKAMSMTDLSPSR